MCRTRLLISINTNAAPISSRRGVRVDDARGGTRTHKAVKPADFEFLLSLRSVSRQIR
jgi:hypothetical protein